MQRQHTLSLNRLLRHIILLFFNIFRPGIVMRKYAIIISISVSLLCVVVNAQDPLPVLFLTPGQLVTGGNIFQGYRVKMELAFAYKASIQSDSIYRKCTMEGKFRETHLKEDEYILYEIYIPNTLYVQNYQIMEEGKHLTIIGKVVDSDGAFSKIIVEEIQSGWSSDVIGVIQDTLAGEDHASPDSVIFRVEAINDSLGGRQDSLVRRVVKDTVLKRVKQDTSWIK